MFLSKAGMNRKPVADPEIRHSKAKWTSEILSLSKRNTAKEVRYGEAGQSFGHGQCVFA